MLIDTNIIIMFYLYSYIYFEYLLQCTINLLRHEWVFCFHNGFYKNHKTLIFLLYCVHGSCINFYNA